MDYLKQATKLKNQLIMYRRKIHSYAEVGMNLPKTVDFVISELKAMGYSPKKVGQGGVTATIGCSGKVILLRADMDALPMEEKSGEPFASTNGNCHGCGHDMHTAMLLGAAKLLKENEAQLSGTVKLMFQPGEELFKGSKDMIEAGILENPKVDAALAIHTATGVTPLGVFMYNNSSTMMCSADTFKITIKGKGSHGSYPQNSIDPINIAAHVILATQEVIARETIPSELCVLTIGSINAGSMANSIPESAVITGSIRASSKEMRSTMVSRTKEIAELTAATFRGTCEFELLSGTPPLICNPQVVNSMVKYINELDFQGKSPYPGLQANASEDFAEISDRIPSAYMMLGAGFPTDPKAANAHDPAVRFNEDALPIGAAILAHCAERWLADNQ